MHTPQQHRHIYTESLADGFDVDHIHMQVLACIDHSYDVWVGGCWSGPRSLDVEVATDHARTVGDVGGNRQPTIETTVDTSTLELCPSSASPALLTRQAERFIASALSAAARRANRGISRVSIALRESSKPGQPLVWAATHSRTRTVPPRQFRRTRAALTTATTAGNATKAQPEPKRPHHPVPAVG